MTTWTTFANLTGATTPELDANFLILSGLVNVPCNVSGTNTLTLTSTANTASLAGYLNYLNLDCVAAASNTGATTANFQSFGALNVYKDTVGGPALLTGGEIIANCEFTLIYDSALNSSAGGFHLKGGGGTLSGQTINVNSINSTLGSINSFSFSNMNGATASITSLTAPNFLGTSISVVNFIGQSVSINNLNGTVTMAAMQMGSVVNPLTRFQSTLASFSFGTVLPQGTAQTTVSFAGCSVLDGVIIGPPAASSLGISYQGLVLAAGSIGVRAINTTNNATISLASATFRVINMGFAT